MYEHYLPGLLKRKYSLFRALLLVAGCCCALQTMAQPNTEVFVVSLETTIDGIRFTNLRNISNNPGYDNQPSFFNDNLVLFSSTRNGQTDIAAYALNKDSLNWKSKTPEGSEYSPLKIPGEKKVSAIRLDIDGTQLLYSYDMDSGSSTTLLNDLKVGYHAWYNRELIVSSVLTEDRMDLVVSNLKDHTNYTFQKNVGRSLHKIPNSELMSYISKEKSAWELKSLDPISGATGKITAMISGVQDVCWMINGTVLAGWDNKIMKFTPGVDTEWKLAFEFPANQISNITRLITNSISNQLAFVAEIPDSK